MNSTMTATTTVAKSVLQKPLHQLTEDDISQLTREDCRRYLKDKGSTSNFQFHVFSYSRFEEFNSVLWLFDEQVCEDLHGINLRRFNKSFLSNLCLNHLLVIIILILLPLNLLFFVLLKFLLIILLVFFFCDFSFHFEVHSIYLLVFVTHFLNFITPII